MGSMLAGTKYRGDFEKKLKGLLKEVSKIPNAILFIDEIHTIVGAGSVSGSAMDASNIVITSYSIHYTKLYENVKKRVSFHHLKKI